MTELNDTTHGSNMSKPECGVTLGVFCLLLLWMSVCVCIRMCVYVRAWYCSIGIVVPLYRNAEVLDFHYVPNPRNNSYQLNYFIAMRETFCTFFLFEEASGTHWTYYHDYEKQVSQNISELSKSAYEKIYNFDLQSEIGIHCKPRWFVKLLILS